MPDIIHVLEDEGFIRVHSHGVVTAKDVRSTIERIVEANRSQGINKVLVDTREQQRMPSTHSILTLFGDYPRGIRTALVMRPGQATAADIRFAENIARNRARPIKAFFDEQQALDWLRGDK